MITENKWQMEIKGGGGGVEKRKIKATGRIFDPFNFKKKTIFGEFTIHTTSAEVYNNDELTKVQIRMSSKVRHSNKGGDTEGKKEHGAAESTHTSGPPPLEYEVIAFEPCVPMAQSIVASFPQRFRFHPTKWGRFDGGLDDHIEVGGFTPVNNIRGRHILFLVCIRDVLRSFVSVWEMSKQSCTDSHLGRVPYE